MEAERLTVPEAARQLGISSVAVRKRVKRGTLRAVKADGLWYVELPTGQSASLPGLAAIGEAVRQTARPDSPALETPRADGPGGNQAVGEFAKALHEALGLLASERDRAGAAEQAAAMWQERARNLEGELERALALPAHEEPEPRRRWWRFWRRGIPDSHPTASRAV